MISKWQTPVKKDVRNLMNEWLPFCEACCSSAQLEDVEIHFLHLPSAGAMLILMVHGWPGTFNEFQRIALS
jgi:hypothetical protein